MICSFLRGTHWKIVFGFKFTSIQMPELNPGQLDGKRKHYLCAMQSPVQQICCLCPLGSLKYNLNESLRTQCRWKKLRRLYKTCFFVPRWSKSLYVHLIQYLPQEADFMRKLNLKPASKNSSPQFSVGFGINAGSIELYRETYTSCYYVEDCILCLERCW